ncbi:MAG: excinuclease ABC subunit UvrC [Actinobacteria bacterium]|nr:excinuclease ABC subunit UvrC [Actinomycetota bacterium]
MSDPKNYRPSNVPDEPGVYRFFNNAGKVIYVGKARSLKNRINSYFQNNLPEKTFRMVQASERVDWTVVESEVAALQLEFSWIKEENPEYNVQFKDDKSYPYLAISVKEEVPRVFVTRRQKQKGIKYFGPYAHAWALRTTFDLILETYPIRSCSASNFERAQKSKRHCLLGDIGKCTAPCVGRITADEHRQLVNLLIEFMDSGNQDIENHLKAEMARASAAEDFERAAKLRDKLRGLEIANESNEAAISESISADFIAIHEDITHSAASIFRIRKGRIVGSRSWIIDRTNLVEDVDLATAALEMIYRDLEISTEIEINLAVTGLSELENFLGERAGRRVKLSQPNRGERLEILEVVRRNANQALIQFLSKRSNDAAISGRALEELANAVEMEELPLRIECFDISNIQGTSVVASMVVFEDGQPKKSDYRRFGIEDKEKFDDTRAMNHVITRRFKRYLAEKDLSDLEGSARPKFAYPPQLLIVDGGRGQVNAAARALADLGITNVTLVGLAKRLEEIWFPDRAYPVILPRNSEALYLVQRIRDEAHRFAITFHRSKRSRLMLESLLDEISGLGESRRSALMQRYGSIAALRKATAEEIAAIPGIGAKTSKMIVSVLQRNESITQVDAKTGEIIEHP